MMRRQKDHEPLEINHPLIQKFLSDAKHSPQPRYPYSDHDEFTEHSNMMLAMQLEARKKHGIAFWNEAVGYFQHKKHTDVFAGEVMTLIQSLLLDLERLSKQVESNDRSQIFGEYYFEKHHLAPINALFSRFTGGENSGKFPTQQRYYLEDGGSKLCFSISFLDIFTHDFYRGKITNPSIVLANTTLSCLQEYISGLARLQEMMSGAMPIDLHEHKIRILTDTQPRAAIGFSNYVRDKTALRSFLRGGKANEIVVSEEIFPLFFEQKDLSKIPPWFQEEYAVWMLFSESERERYMARARADIDHFNTYYRRKEPPQTR